MDYIKDELRPRSENVAPEVVKAWAVLSVIIDSYLSANPNNERKLPAGTAEKMFALFLLLRPDLDGPGYKRVFDSRGPVTEGRLKNSAGQTFISDHIQDLERLIPLDYLHAEQNQLEVNIPLLRLEKWRALGLFTNNLEQDARDFGWCLGSLSSKQIRALGAATNYEIVLQGIEKNLSRGYSIWSSIDLYLENGKVSLDNRLTKAQQWLSGGEQKTEQYEDELPEIRQFLHEKYRASAEFSLPQIATLRKLLEYANELKPDDLTHYLKVAYNCRVLLKLVTLVHHIINCSNAFEGSQPCNKGSSCHNVVEFRREINSAIETGVFNSISIWNDFGQIAEQLHEHWCSGKSRPKTGPQEVWVRTQPLATEVIGWLETTLLVRSRRALT